MLSAIYQERTSILHGNFSRGNLDYQEEASSFSKNCPEGDSLHFGNSRKKDLGLLSVNYQEEAEGAFLDAFIIGQLRGGVEDWI